MRRRPADASLRHRGLAELGGLAPPLALEALGSAVLEIEPDVLAWEGTLGTRRAHRVLLVVEPDLADALRGAPSAVDALTRALAAALADGGEALAALDIEARVGARAVAKTSPYRG